MPQLSKHVIGDVKTDFMSKSYAFTPVLRGSCWGLGVAIANEPGFSPISLTHFASRDHNSAATEAERLNLAELDMPENVAFTIVASSIAAASPEMVV